MKKFILFLYILVLCLSNSIFIANGAENPTTCEPQSDTYMAFDTATNFLKAIKSRDYKAISEYIHPENGVLFSPYAHIDDTGNLTLTPNQVYNSNKDNKIFIWGVYDNSSLNIELTMNDYFENFIYDKDYLYVNQIAINSIIRTGNCIDNVDDIFTDAIFVEFYDDGPIEFEGLGWSSLKIVMEKYNGKFKVVGIIHSSYNL